MDYMKGRRGPVDCIEIFTTEIRAKKSIRARKMRGPRFLNVNRVGKTGRAKVEGRS